MSAYMTPYLRLMANKNANVTIRLVSFRDQGSEADWVWEEARKRARPSTPSVILFPTHKALAGFSFELARQLCIDTPPSALPARLALTVSRSKCNWLRSG